MGEKRKLTVVLCFGLVSFVGCVTPVTRAPVPSAPVAIAAPTTSPARAPATSPASAPATSPARTQDEVVERLVRVARRLPELPEQIEVTVSGRRWTCYRWPLGELLAGRITAETLWHVYVREVRTDGSRLDFEIR